MGKTSASDLSKFHDDIKEVANSPLLRDVVAYHAARENKLKAEAEEIGQRLIASGFASPSKRKNEKEAGIITEVGPVVAQSVLNYFSSTIGQKTLHRMERRR